MSLGVGNRSRRGAVNLVEPPRACGVLTMVATMRVRLLAATLGVGILAGCATGPYTSREPWEVYVQASPQANGLVHVRTYTLAPTACYAAGEIRSAPSTQAQSIQVQAILADGRYGSCDSQMTEVVHDLPGLQLEPDDRFLEVVVSADGVERNRVLIDIAAAPPVGTYGQPYAPYANDPRYDDRYRDDPTYPQRGFANQPYGR